MTITINGTTGIAGVDGSASTPAVQGTDTNTGVFFGTDTVTISTGGTAAVTVDSGQRTKFPTTIGVGGATPSTSGSGISFPATASASSDVNTLDDYEEGTWTPTAGSNTANLNIQNATYTKIGRVVTLNTWIKVDINAAAFEIAGLPFNISGRTAISLTNITNNQALGNQVVTATVFGYGATTGLQRDVFIGGVYHV
jgi:hypothetical protein